MKIKEISPIKVTIIVPIYNTSDYLKKCLDSICGQTLKEIEIICVDDGSDDASVEIVRSYVRKDPRIQLLLHEHNGKGAAGARNMGLESAKGEYVLFLDSDDWFEVELAERTYRKAKQINADIVFYDGYYYSEADDRTYVYDNKITDFRKMPSSDCFMWRDIKDSIFQTTPGWVWNQLFRRRFLMENRIRFQEIFHIDDAYFSYTALMSAKRITYVKERFIYYRYRRPNGQAAQIDKKPLSAPHFVMSLRNYLLETNLYNEVKISFLILGIQFCKGYLDGFCTKEAFEKLYIYLKENVYPLLIDDELGNKKSTRWLYVHCGKVLYMDAMEYLLDENMALRNGLNSLAPEKFFLPTDRVIVYGAGNFGTSYIIQILTEKYCRLAGWVDKNFESIGFPVQDPKELSNMEFDKVIIGIVNEETAMDVKAQLINSGISKEKIYWKKQCIVSEEIIEDAYRKIKAISKE